MSAKKVLHPTVLWAQRDSILYLTIEVEDMQIADLTISDKSLHVKGANGTGSVDYECTLEFFGDVDGAKYRRIASSRHVELVIPKAANGWWPRLLKDAAKVPWVKVDFNKWKDEDDDEYSGGMGGMGGDFDFNDYMGKMGAGGGKYDAPGIDDDLEDDDEDDADMPDLEDAEENAAKTTDDGETTTVDADEPGPSAAPATTAAQ